VRDGAEALEFIFCEGQYAGRNMHGQPSLMLLDLKLPKVDGIEVLRRVKSDERTRTIPVVVLTSAQEESDVVQSYNLGVNSYIVKPVDFGKFADTVVQVGLYWVVTNKAPRAAVA
jgi:two-component system response regulator